MKVNSLDGRQKKTCCQEKLLGLKTSSYNEFLGEKKTALWPMDSTQCEAGPTYAGIMV